MNVYCRMNGEARADWHDVEDLEGVGCCDCSEPAEEVVEAGHNRDGQEILWAMCDGCAEESHACTMDARAHACYECEGY